MDLVLTGQDVELDTRVLDAVADSLRHLVTNAVDHGCETAAQRQTAGKPARATVTVAARSAGSTVVIEVSDDGQGVDEESLRSHAVARGLLPPESTATGPALLQVMFAPGFSTRDEVTITSGRGVGLDVVRTVVEDLSGALEVRSEQGAGTTFVITLPVTLGVLRCLLARVGTERYALPVAGVVETIGLASAERHEVAGVPVIARDGRTMPVVDLGVALAVVGDRDPRAAVVVHHGSAGEMLALAVDALEGEREVVVKELGGFLGRLPAVAGATIDGDGSVVLVLDLRELAARQLAIGAPAAAPSSPAPAGDRTGADLPGQRQPGRPRVLVVEDSVGVRELQRVILEGAGYDVVTAVDGSRRRLPPRRRAGRPGAVRRRDARYGRIHPDPHAAPYPWLGGRPGRDHDVPGRRGGPARRTGRRCQRLPAQERVRPGRTHRYGPASAGPLSRLADDTED